MLIFSVLEIENLLIFLHLFKIKKNNFNNHKQIFWRNASFLVVLIGVLKYINKCYCNGSGHSTGQSTGQSTGHSNVNANDQSNGNGSGHFNGNGNGNGNSDGNGNGNGNGKAHGNGNGDVTSRSRLVTA
jgi:hypothetical protein